MSMRYVVAKFLWAVALAVFLVDMALYLKRDVLVEEKQKICDISILLAARENSVTKTSAVTNHTTIATSNTTASQEFCRPDSPCVYPERVDFRIIVMTYNRKDSLVKLLKSLEDLELDGDSAALEIFLDRSKKDNTYHNQTYEAAKDFSWNRGLKRVHVWDSHVGIYGQWIDSWRPRQGEIALILEDDMSVSKHCYRWLKAAHAFYGPRTDISGYTLQSSNVNSAKGGKRISAPKDQPAFLYRVLGSWGFSPHPGRWQEFQDWYHELKSDVSFHPYVPGLVMTNWYKEFEKKKKKHDSMWTMWHIWFTDHHKLFCLHHNLRAFSNLKSSALGVNRQEPGLHFSGKGRDNTNELLTQWNPKYVEFSNKTIKYDYDASVLKD
jgi:hypothetical protein